MATLYVLQGPDKGCTYEFGPDSAVLGRHSAQVPLSDHTVSRRHARLDGTDSTWQLTDLGSANGTYLNGERLTAPAPLRPGDQIRIGSTMLVFGGTNATHSGPAGGSRPDLVDVDAGDNHMDASILSSVQSCEDSVILASPETAEAVRSWNLIYQLAEALESVTATPAFLERAADIITTYLPVERLVILLRDEPDGELEAAVVRSAGETARDDRRIGTSRTVINHVLQTRSGVLCANAGADQRFGHSRKSASLHSLGLRSVLCAPIVAQEAVRGILYVDCAMATRTYTHEQLRLITAVGRILGLALENRRLLEQRVHNERLAAVGEAVAYLSHHIRNILQGLRSGADVVELGLRKQQVGNIAAGWSIVQHNLERIFQLTTNMLTFSKDRRPSIELAQVTAIVEDVLKLVERQVAEKGVAITTRLEELPDIPLDAHGVHQALFNVVINAIAACPRSQGQVQIESAYDPAQEVVTITVTDNGPGVRPEQIKRLFRPFYSSKGQGGTGLGLAAARKILDELGGSISVEPAPGGGSSFIVRLRSNSPTPDPGDDTR